MKKLLLLMSLITAFSCGNADIKQQQIEQRIKDNAMGADLSYEPEETTIYHQISHQDIIENFRLLVDEKEISLPDLIEQAKKRKEVLRQQNNVDVFNFLNFEIPRLEAANEAKDKNKTAYTVYLHKYSIINLLAEGERRNVEKYFYFKGDSLLYDVSEIDMQEAKKQYIQNDAQPFEMLLIDETQ